MSISSPATQKEFTEFCLRQLGKPVVKIDVEENQVNDAVETALQFWNEFHFNGTVRTYLKYAMTAQDITNEYVTLNPNILGVTRIFNIGDNLSSMSFFDMRYQLRLNDLWDLSTTSYTSYAMTMQHLHTMDMLFVGEQPIRFNVVTHQLYLDWDWKNDVSPGEYIIVECKVITDPFTYVDVWNDRMLKKLAVAYIKKQWGTNMKKYGNVQMIGGVTLNGQQIFDEATIEIYMIEANIQSTYQEPPAFLVG